MLQRFFNILSSVSLLVVVYLINCGIGVGEILGNVGVKVDYDLPLYFSYASYIVGAVVYAWLLTKLFGPLRPGELRKEHITELDADNSGLLAMILAYIFVGLSINNGWTLLAVLCFLLFSIFVAVLIYIIHCFTFWVSLLLCKFFQNEVLGNDQNKVSVRLAGRF